MTDNGSDFFQDSRGYGRSVERGDAVTFFGAVKPGVGEPMASADADRENTMSGLDPVK